jgi:hypothetical protein
VSHVFTLRRDQRVDWHIKCLKNARRWRPPLFAAADASVPLTSYALPQERTPREKAFELAREDHIAVYGPDNHMRLTGKHETAAINQFTYGVADRGASIRVPHRFVNNGYKGYLEDRRPNSQGDPYQIASQILKTIASVPTSGKVSAAA